MATYNPRAGLPKRKTYGYVAEMVKAPEDVFPKSSSDLAVERLASLPEPAPSAMDANELRSWLMGYMDSIEDCLPCLSQWRRIREEVGRSVAVKEPVKET